MSRAARMHRYSQSAVAGDSVAAVGAGAEVGSVASAVLVSGGQLVYQVRPKPATPPNPSPLPLAAHSDIPSSTLTLTLTIHPSPSPSTLTS